MNEESKTRRIGGVERNGEGDDNSSARMVVAVTEQSTAKVFLECWNCCSAVVKNGRSLDVFVLADIVSAPLKVIINVCW